MIWIEGNIIMAAGIKQQILANLQQLILRMSKASMVKETGQQRGERIREIVKSAVSELGSELRTC